MDMATLPRTFEAVTRVDGSSASLKRTDMEETPKDIADMAYSMRLNPIITSQSDTAGNMYVTQPGRDPSLTSIGIFTSGSQQRHFLSAARVFRRLQDEDLLCGVTLIGWASAGGRDAWVSVGSRAATDSKDGGHVMPAGLAYDLDPSSVSFSAIIDVVDDDGGVTGSLEIVGSPVLVEQARRIAPAGAVFEGRGTVVRAPEVRIMGEDAERVACALVREYSEYVGALFDNFD